MYSIFSGYPRIGVLRRTYRLQYLLQRMIPKVADDRIRYAKQYASIIWLCPSQLLQFSPAKRLHIMRAISSLARYTGQTERWKQMLQQYQLSWSTGTEKIDAFNRFFDSSKDLDTMLRWLREALAVLPSDYANFLRFCTLTGLRGSEAVEAVRLLRVPQLRNPYYNPDQKVLQHYRFPDIFIRRTKAVYISVVNDSIMEIARKIRKPGSSALKWQTSHRKLSMRVKYCRKIYASWLHLKEGISSELVDMLQGRIGENIFLRHYLTPSSDFKDKVLDGLVRLKQALEENKTVVVNNIGDKT